MNHRLKVYRSLSQRVTVNLHAGISSELLFLYTSNKGSSESAHFKSISFYEKGRNCRQHCLIQLSPFDVCHLFSVLIVCFLYSQLIITVEKCDLWLTAGICDHWLTTGKVIQEVQTMVAVHLCMLSATLPCLRSRPQRRKGNPSIREHCQHMALLCYVDWRFQCLNDRSNVKAGLVHFVILLKP